MSTLQKAVGVAGQADCPVSSGPTFTMPVSLLTSQDSVMCDSGSESMGFSDTSTDIGSSIKDTLFNIKALNREEDILSLTCEKPETNGVSVTKGEEIGKGDDLDNSTDRVDDESPTHVDLDDKNNGSPVDLVVEKNIFDELSNDGCTPEKNENDLPKNKMTENTDDKSQDVPMTDCTDDDKSSDVPTVEKEESDKSPAVLPAENVEDDNSDDNSVDTPKSGDDNSVDNPKSGDEPAGESSDDKLLKEDLDESSDKLPVGEEDELRLLMEVNEAEQSKEEDCLTTADDSMTAETTDPAEKDLTENDKAADSANLPARGLMEVDEAEQSKEEDCLTTADDSMTAETTDPAEEDLAENDKAEDSTSLPARVASPMFSECGSSQSSLKPDLDIPQSDSESSNSSRKHPLRIGHNMKYSFQGIMKTAVHRVSQDSDSARSSPRRDDSPQRTDSRPCSPKPCSPKPDSSTGSQSVEDNVTDSVADLSTAPQTMNLFEKLGLLTDNAKAIENVSESDTIKDTNKAELKNSTDEIVADKCASPRAAINDECMETDSPKLEEAADSNSDTSTVSVDHPSACEDISGDVVMKEEKSECSAVTVKADTVSQMDEVKCSLKKEVLESQNIVHKNTAPDIEKHNSKDPNLIKSKSKMEPSAPEHLVKTDNKSENSKSFKLIVKFENAKDTAKSDRVKCEKSEGLQAADEVDSDSQDRKRSANEDPEEDSIPKRSRLDFMIGKLGSQIGISPEHLTCEQMSDSDVEGSCKASSDSTENRSEEVTSEDDESGPARRITEESLEKLIKQKIKTVLDQQREVLTKQFRTQIEALQASNESWKTQAKELHRRAVELMTHQQRQDRHRAARTSGQRRNVGIQVGEERINSLNAQSTSKQTVTSPGRISLLASPSPSSVNNQMLVQKMAVPTVIHRHGQTPAPTVKSILNGNRLAQMNAPITHPTTSGTQTPIQPAKTKLTSSPTIQTLVKVIDLTSDDESSSKAVSTSSSTTTIYRPVTSGLPTGVQPGTRILLSSGATTQLMTPSISSANARPRQPGVQYQYLYAPTNPAIRQGNMVTLVHPHARPALTMTTPAPPQLTRPTLTTVVRPSQPNAVLIRAPPPLYSAPNTVTKSNATPPTPEVIPTSEKKTAEVTPTPDPTKHPAPLPPIPANQDMAAKLKQLPPKPGLKISRVSQGIVLSWNMATSNLHADIASYQLFAYQETSAPAGINLWKKVGDVKALPLPMACTLTQFQEGNKYHFAVRAVDIHTRVSGFSDPCTIHLVAQSSK